MNYQYQEACLLWQIIPDLLTLGNCRPCIQASHPPFDVGEI